MQKRGHAGAFKPTNTLARASRNPDFKPHLRSAMQVPVQNQAAKRPGDLQEIGQLTKRSKVTRENVEISESSSGDELGRFQSSAGSQTASNCAFKQKSKVYKIPQYEAVENRMSSKRYSKTSGYQGTARIPQLPLTGTESYSHHFPRRSSQASEEVESPLLKDRQAANGATSPSTGAHRQALAVSDDEIVELKEHQPSSVVPPSVWHLAPCKKSSSEPLGTETFPITWIANNRSLDHEAADMALVLNYRESTFDLHIERVMEQNCVFVATKIIQIDTLDSETPTELRLVTSKSEGRGHKIFIRCKSHKVHTDLLRRLSDKNNMAVNKVDP